MTSNKYHECSIMETPFRNITQIPTFSDLEYIGAPGSETTEQIKLCNPCQYNIPIKNKLLEVLEADFSVKYPGVYKTFKEEQDRQLLEFIQVYLENHEGKSND